MGAIRLLNNDRVLQNVDPAERERLRKSEVTCQRQVQAEHTLEETIRKCRTDQHESERFIVVMGGLGLMPNVTPIARFVTAWETVTLINRSEDIEFLEQALDAAERKEAEEKLEELSKRLESLESSNRLQDFDSKYSEAYSVRPERKEQDQNKERGPWHLGVDLDLENKREVQTEPPKKSEPDADDDGGGPRD